MMTRAGDHGPVTGPLTNGWYTGAATVTLTATDDGGTASPHRVPGRRAALDAYTEPIVVTGDGVHTVRFRSTDEAGNVEETKSVEVRIDTTAPVTTATFARRPTPAGTTAPCR